MTTTPEEEVGSAEPTDTQDAFEQMAEEFFPDEPEGEESDEAEPETGEDEAEIDDEQEDEELPDIDPPVSLTAEEKEEFKTLPREAQEILVRRVGALEKGFQSKAQQAANAERNAQQAALEQLAQIERNYSQQFQQIAQQFTAQRPDPRLLTSDPQTYSQQLYAFEQAEAQRQYAQQQAEAYAQQAAQREEQIERETQQREAQILSENLPGFFDPQTGSELRRKLTDAAKAMGYSDELITNANAQDILAMNIAAEWKAKADQLDKLNKSKMQKVRSAKGKMATPGMAGGQAQNRAARAASAFEAAKNSQGKQRVDNFADYLEQSGQI